MLEVGLTAVADHPTLAANGKTSSLKDLAQYFPIMEMDTGFYHIPSRQTVLNWQAQVPSGMRFIIKASQWMTLHKEDPEIDVSDQFNQLREAVAPLMQSQQLVALMFQMPPWFAVTRPMCATFNALAACIRICRSPWSFAMTVGTYQNIGNRRWIY
jgi:uncharacterized protein YecE (DUF72 family)